MALGVVRGGLAFRVESEGCMVRAYVSGFGI